jgi:hypothetical protein
LKVTLARWGSWREGDALPLLALRGASEVGRALYTLAKGWPELAEGHADTGIYQPLGAERRRLSDAVARLIRPDRLDDFKPANAIFSFSPFGAFTALAIALRCEGPFWPVEGGAEASVLATAQALRDLTRGHCAQALVGAVRDPDRAWLTLFRPARGDEPGVRWHTERATTAGDLAAARARAASALGAALEVLEPPADDFHGGETLVETLSRASAGRPTALWQAGPHGGGALLGFAR